MDKEGERREFRVAEFPWGHNTWWHLIYYCWYWGATLAIYANWQTCRNTCLVITSCASCWSVHSLWLLLLPINNKLFSLPSQYSPTFNPVHYSAVTDLVAAIYTNSYTMLLYFNLILYIVQKIWKKKKLSSNAFFYFQKELFG